MKKISPIRLVMLKCAGADVETLQQCTSAEVTKYVIYGTCVLIPSVFAIFSGGYSAWLMTGSIFPTILIAALWSWGIFTIDRAIVANTRPGRATLGAFGRIVLAVVISVTIAEPLSLRFFQDKIEQQRSDALQQKKDSVDRVLNQDLQKLDSIKQQQWIEADKKYKIFEQEADGTGGSGKRGIDTIAKAKLADYKADTQRIARDQKKRDIQADTLRARAETEKIILTKSDADGLLGRVAILGTLQDKDKHVWWAVWLVRAFFFIIEVIPILIKVGSPSDEDLYHDITKANNQDSKDVQKSLKKRKDEIFELEQLLILQERKDKLEVKLKKSTAIDALRDQEFMMFKVKEAGEKKEKVESRIFETIKNEVFREQLLASLQKVFDEYEKAIQALVVDMTAYYKKTTERNQPEPENV
jgi:hypothetical protein